MKTEDGGDSRVCQICYEKRKSNQISSDSKKTNSKGGEFVLGNEPAEKVECTNIDLKATDFSREHDSRKPVAAWRRNATRRSGE
jgi:uncharacterized protein (DUF169 family)